MPHLTHPPPPHISQFSLFSIWPVTLILVLLFFFIFTQHNTTHIHTLLSLTLPLVYSSSPPLFFRQDHRKTLKNITHSHKLFEVKVLINLCGYYVFVWGYFYPSFNNDVLEIYELLGWYSCNFVYGFLIWWTNLMSGFIVLLVVAN